MFNFAEQSPSMQMSRLYYESARVYYFYEFFDAEMSRFVRKVYNPIGEVGWC